MEANDKKMIDLTLGDFSDLLASNAPAPGGGAVAALSGATGVALIMMVANLTVGKKRYAEYEEENQEALTACAPLLEGMKAGIDEDKDAFTLVSNAYAMSKETDEEKQARKDAIAEASVGAAEAPLRVIRQAAEAIVICRNLIGRSNPNLVSDLYVAALELQAATSAALMNVEANLPSIRDEELRARFEEEAKEGSETVERLAAEILNR